MTTTDNDLREADNLSEPNVSLGENDLARATLERFGHRDFTAADYFEAYADAIEAKAQRIERFEAEITQYIRMELLDVLQYFSAPSSDYRLWPQSGLRALAMLAPIHVASGLLGPSEDLLQLAIRSQRPNKSWAWWRGLGVAILSEASDTDIMAGFKLTPRAVKKYRKFLVGRQRAAGKAA